MKKSFSLILVLIVIFIDWLGIGLVYPMFSSMLFQPDSHLLGPEASESARSWYLGILLAAMPIAQFFSGPLLGALSDQKGRRPFFLYTLVIGACGYFLSMVGVLIESIALLIASRFIVGIAAGNAAVVSATIADISSDENKAKNFGLYSMACGIGFSVGPLVGGQLSVFGFEVPFFLAGIVILINLALIYFFFKETHPGKEGISIRLDRGIRSLAKAFQMKGLRALFLSNMLFCLGWSFFYEFIPVVWIYNYGFSASQIGIAYAYGAGFYALSSGLLIRPFLSRFKHAAILFYTLIVFGLTILLLLLQPEPVWVWIYLPCINFMTAMIWPTTTTMVSDFSTKEAQGETLGIYQSLQAAVFGFSPIAAGPLLAAGPHMPMLAAGISLLIAAIVFGVPLRKKIFPS